MILPVALASFWWFLAFMRLDNVFTRSNAQSTGLQRSLICILPNGIAAVPEIARLLHHCFHRRSEGTMLTNGLCGTSEIKVLASGDIELLHNTSGDKFKEVTSPLPALARPGMLTSSK
jgi:hypothetical protein